MLDLGRIGQSEEQADLFDVASDFCRNKSPISSVRALIEDETGHDSALWSEIAELGWLGVAIPEEFGGVGLGLAEVAPIVECMGRHLMQSPFVSTTLAAQAIVTGGTLAQKSEWLPKLATGTAAALALVEADEHADIMAPSATASVNGSNLILSGTKRLVTDAAAAEVLVISVLYDGKPALVATETTAIPAENIRRETIIDETKRSYEINLNGVQLPVTALMDPDLSDATFKTIHLAGNLLSAADMVGANKSVIDYMVDYLNTRKQFGKLIGSYQALKHPVADAFAMYERARSHMYSAAHCFTEGLTGEVATRMAKVSSVQSLSYASDRAIQFHGGFGFTYDCDAQLYRRRAIWHASQFGDVDYHKGNLAELILDA